MSLLRKQLSKTSYSLQDQARVLTLIDRAHASIKPYDGNWKAEWLLSEIHDDKWVLGKTRAKDHCWAQTQSVSWDWVLPHDGSLLTDHIHDEIRHYLQKMAFLVRYLPSFRLETAGSHSTWITGFKNFVRFLYLHNDIYQLDQFGLARLDTAGITEYIHRTVEGGAAWAVCIPQRLFQLFYSNAS